MKKRILCLLLALIMVCAGATTVFSARSLDNFQKVNTYQNGMFTDVKATSWYAENVKTAYELALMKGKSANEFSPTSDITIAESITLASRLHSIYYTGKESFVQGKPWYQVYVDYAKENGIIAGEQLNWDFNAKATRGQFAQILAYALPSTAFAKLNDVSFGEIPDVVGSEAFGDAVYRLYNAGVLTGSDEYGTFYADRTIVRSEVAAIVTRIADESLRRTFEPKSKLDYLKGYQFKIANGKALLPQTNEDGSYKDATQEEYAEKLAALEKRLGITIRATDLPSGDATIVLTIASFSGAKYGDAVYTRSRYFFSVANAGGLTPLDDSSLIKAGLDPTDEVRWYQPVTQQTEFLGHTWGLSLASKYIPVQSGFFVTYNKGLCARAGYGNMYQLVREGKWTWEVYRDIARKSTIDLNRDGAPDIWGTGATAWGNEALTNGVQFVDEVDGKWKVTIDSEAGIEALQFLVELNYTDGTRCDAGSGECRRAFANGSIAFNWAEMGHINGPGSAIYDADHDYGVLPMPMGPRATEYVSATDTISVLVIQSTNRDVEETVAILNEFAEVANHPTEYTEIFNDGRLRTVQDYEMMTEYILPNLLLNKLRIDEAVWDIGDSGMISGVSYYGMTPRQAIEAYKDPLQAALDDFFGQ